MVSFTVVLCLEHPMWKIRQHYAQFYDSWAYQILTGLVFRSIEAEAEKEQS